MLFKHLKQELKDAETQGWREEARIVSRNSILVAAAALTPLAIIKAILVMALWKAGADMPPLMSNTAYYYPATALAGIVIGILLHNAKHYTGAMIAALAPFLWIPTFIATALYWALR